MNGYIYDPLLRFRDEYKEKFAELTRRKFQELTEKSGIDIKANRRLANIIEQLEASAGSAKILGNIFGFFKWAGGIIFLFAFCISCIGASEPEIDEYWPLAGFSFFTWLICFIISNNLREKIENLKGSIDEKKKLAWKQMKCLNSLYSWDITQKLIETAVPQISFDKYFTARRLAELERLYGFDRAMADEKSLLFAHSGTFAGNPFVFGEILEQDWETETYTGSKTIYWTEHYRDSEGHLRSEQHSETLYASIEAEKPSYDIVRFLAYGNDAAPNLIFTRMPSKISEMKDGFWKTRKLKKEIKKLENFSRVLNDDSQYTIMRNREFEALFKTTDRNNEVEYRLLFTDVAQKQMLDLIKDNSIGYGDDFTFLKQNMMNMIFPKHLSEGSLNTDPKIFHFWNYDTAKDFFLSFNEDYFKKIYFALAPIMAIPLYQMTKNHEEIWKDVIKPGEQASDWEYETLANYHGEEYFEHKNCITHSILKAENIERNNGISHVAVTAYGFRGIKHTDYISKFGGDGHFHNVPVEWIEYKPVERTSEMIVSEKGNTSPAFQKRFQASRHKAFRRTLFSFLDR